MSSSAAESTPEAPDLPDVYVLHDALYELVATGVGIGTREKIERFLHEHARQPKDRAVFVAFFEANGLPMPDDSGAFPEPTLSEISMARLPLPHVDDPRPLSLDVVRELADETQPRIPIEAEIAAATPRSGAMLLPWAVLVLVIGLCGAGAWWGYETLTGLQGDLREAERRGDESQRVIRDLEARAQELESRAAGIQSSVAANGELIQRMDQKSDLLLERLPEPKPRRWSRPRPRVDADDAVPAAP